MLLCDTLVWEGNKNMGENCICLYVMESGWRLYGFKCTLFLMFSFSTLSFKGRRESIIALVYIKFCYFYVVVFIFFYKVGILSILYFISKIRNALCHGTIVVTRR